MINNLGYSKNLFVLPFDHRSSFKNLFSNDKDVIEAKKIIYEGFLKAVSKTIPKEEAAILIDEQYGKDVIKDAKEQGFTILIATEKSGQKEFQFEYGENFAAHLEKYKPTFAKALIRYNPQNPVSLTSKKNLQKLSTFCHENGFKFLLEVLISSEEMRPNLALKIIEELQNVQIEPDVWKLEGMENENDYNRIIEKIRRNGRGNVGLVVLGRNANEEKVEKWISIGAKVNGVIGFAVGRTVFLKPLMDFRNGKIEREITIDYICKNYERFYKIFVLAKKLI